ncbi:hypothetical protein PIB30_087186 [Stylosanthes scabra]|uniref:Uncharacterized protein n=1 Tax=Stylosanthes scabra TaxID=79078 RepID=A0ABU6SUU3_9FABA|nr:hypothetical protein [Stylosanthes scabra]
MEKWTRKLENLGKQRSRAQGHAQAPTRPSILLATLKRNTSSSASKVSCPSARITCPGVSHPAFRDNLTPAMLRRHVPTPMRASHQDPASRTKTRPCPGTMHLCLGVGSLPSPANPAPRQRPSVGLQIKSRNQSSMTHT